MVRDAENNNSAAMYVVNYPEGGWAIISATRNYFPVLAYSDEGSFKMRPEEEMGGVVVWLAETKWAIRESENLDEEEKAQVRSQWATYENNNSDISSLPQTRSLQAMSNHINQLYSMYSSMGWITYVPLNEASSYFNYSDYQSLLAYANNLGYSLQYSIVGIKNLSISQSVGPLLSTAWHQYPPFNAFCFNPGNPNNYVAGCVAIAMAQIMKLHRKPALVTSPTNHKYNWNNMPNLGSDTYANTHSTPALVVDIGFAVNMKYGTTVSSSTINDAENAFKNYGYSNNIYQAAHNANTVKNEILNNKRPIFMGGRTQPNNIFGGAQGDGHAWVCDGVSETEEQYEYFVEFFNGSSYINYGYTPYYPGFSYVRYSIVFHMNWGFSSVSPGWFINVSTPLGNFQYERKNLHNIY